MLRLFVCLLVSFSLMNSVAWAQPAPAGGSTSSELSGTRKQLATIIFAGLGGAILGLSTLSFHGRPQDHLSNIAVGFAIGVIGGTVYTTYKAANAPREFFDYGANTEWDYKQLPEQRLAMAGYTWQF